MPLDQVATFQKLLKPVLPTIKPLLPFRRGGPGPKSKFLRGCSDVQFLWTLIAWSVLRYIHRLPQYAFLDVSIRKEVIRGDDSMARKLWESYETTADDGVKDRLEGVTDEIEDYLPEGSCARTIPVSKKEVPAVLNATLARIEHAISIAKRLARTNIPAMKHRNMAKIIPKWTLEGVYAAVQNMHRGRPLQEHGHLPNAQKVNVALAAYYKNAAIRAPEIPKEIVSMNAINADPYLYRGMHGEMAAGAVEKGGLVEAKGYIAFSSNKHMAMTFAHEKTNNNNSNNNNNNNNGMMTNNNNRGTSNNNNNVMSMRSSNNNRGTSNNNNNAMSVRSSNNNRGTSSNNNNAMNNKRPHTVYGSNSNSENEVGSNAWRAKHDVITTWNSNSNVNTSNNNNNVPNKKKNGGFMIRRDGHAIRMQFIMFKLALRDVPRGTPWIWFANDENINTRKAKHAIKSTTAENEVLLPPGKVTFKNLMDRHMSTAIAATMKTPASSSGAFYDASMKKWTAKKTARSVLQTMRTGPKSTTIKILGGFDADVEHIVRASCMHIRYFLKTAQHGAGDTPAVRLASPNIMGIRMLRMIQMACIHHKLGIFDVPDDDSWEPLTFDAIYVPDPSATNATLRRIFMAGPRKQTTGRAPSKGVKRGKSPNVDGYEPLYKMFSANNSRKRTKNGIQKTVSQLTRAVAVVNRQIKASPRRLRPRR